MNIRNQLHAVSIRWQRFASDRQSQRRMAAGINTYIFSVMLILFTFFLLGNYQQFLDRTQYLIMNLLSLAVFLHLTSSFFYLLFNVMIKEKPVFPSRRRRVFFFASTGFSFILFLILQFFNVWLFY